MRAAAGPLGAPLAVPGRDRVPGARESGARESAAPVVPLRRRLPVWAAPALAMAAAALIMVMGAFLRGGGEAPGPAPAPQLANAIEIEDVSTDVDAIVSVVQSEDEDATPIIFIDVLEDDAPASVEGEGTTL